MSAFKYYYILQKLSLLSNNTLLVSKSSENIQLKTASVILVSITINKDHQIHVGSSPARSRKPLCLKKTQIKSGKPHANHGEKPKNTILNRTIYTQWRCRDQYIPERINLNVLEILQLTSQSSSDVFHTTHLPNAHTVSIRSRTDIPLNRMSNKNTNKQN